MMVVWTSQMKADARLRNLGRKHTKRSIKKMEDWWTEERRKTESETKTGHKISDNTKEILRLIGIEREKPQERRDMHRLAQLGEKNSNYKNGMTENKYCNKFDESCREHNREKYDRKCFLCGKTESENGRHLSVHHEDKNKNQGCDDIDWSLIPLCMNCHGMVHGRDYEELWQSRIVYLLKNIWKEKSN